ncbi:Acetyl esterase/lipase [Colwellia chukchiensis]|uniref:Acetyl esterase/lipase n=1 Tax=Colwellia chukchiensis TaxID=641665 RepID=A0A1H7RXK7_9GAMM|nr:alpha/beta hydrolase [Colwellia chukchiensis]SEL65030.1 Acetyl esterase/lipase [Colwellia chukchiensis]
MQAVVSKNLAPLLAQVNAAIADAKKTGTAFETSIVRQNLANLSALMLAGPDIALISNNALNIDGQEVAVRIYHPAPTESLPVLLHFHGGGHMCGSIELYDPISRELAVAANAIVICIDYRLAPEHPYPRGLDDCQYLLENYQSLLTAYPHSDQLYIAGDSAGGAICTSLVMNNLNNPNIKVAKQILIYPSVDYTMSCPSIRENGQGFLLEADKIRWYFEQYFNIERIELNTDDNNQQLKRLTQASPLFGVFDRRMPKTLVLTAGCDPLRDEGVLYAQKAAQAGVDVEHHQFADLIHAYMLLSTLIPEQYQQSFRLIKAFIDKD